MRRRIKIYTARVVELLHRSYEEELAARDAEIERLRRALVSVKTKRTVRERRRGDGP